MTKFAANRPRVGLVGVLGFAGTHLEHLRELHEAGRVEFQSAVVINRNAAVATVRELERRGVTIFSTFEKFVDACAGKLELCVIPTGIPSHAPLTIAALRAGMNVLVEKPLAGSLGDVEAVREAEAAAAGRFVAVGFQDMYDESTLWLKRLLCSGVIGKVQTIRVIGLWPRRRSYYLRNEWAGRLAVDGAAVFDSPMQNAFAHFIHLALFCGGTTFAQSAHVRVGEAELLRAHEIESFDTGVVRAKSDAGVDFWFGVTHASRRQREPEIRIEGTRGHVDWRSTIEMTVTTADGNVERRALPDLPAARRQTYDRVLDRLHNPVAFISSTEMAAAHAVLIEAIHRSAEIQTVPASMIEEFQPEAGGDTIPAVRGLEEALDRAFRARSTLSNIGFNLQTSPST